MKISRRRFVGQASLAVAGRYAFGAEQQSPAIPLPDGVEVQSYQAAQNQLLKNTARSPIRDTFNWRTWSCACTFSLAAKANRSCWFMVAVDRLRNSRPFLLDCRGASVFCAAPARLRLTDRFDYVGVPFWQHAVDFVTGVLDGLNLRKAAVIGNSMAATGRWSSRL
jgi:hypothetical protein